MEKIESFECKKERTWKLENSEKEGREVSTGKEKVEGVNRKSGREIGVRSVWSRVWNAIERFRFGGFATNE